MNPIGYIDRTWNPIAMKCTPISDGCANCWHLSMARRMAANPLISADQRAAYAGGPPVMTDRLNDPLHWRKPQSIAVQFMGDLFHESVPDEMIFQVFSVMGQCTNLIFLLLTKRPRRMLEFLRIRKYHEWPNVWCGVSISNQFDADRLIPILLQIPAHVHFISYEPAIGPVVLRKCWICNGPDIEGCFCEVDSYSSLHWVVCGGETGPHARPTHPDWVRSIRDRCREAGVPFWFKSFGEWALKGSTHAKCTDFGILAPDGTWYHQHTGWNGRPIDPDTGEAYMRRVGHKASGHLLDGVEYRELPE